MINNKILYSLIVACTFPILSAHGADNMFCISSQTLAEMSANKFDQSSDTQDAYDALFDTLIENQENADGEMAGCIAPEQMAQICVDVWGNDVENCTEFVDIVTDTGNKVAGTGNGDAKTVSPNSTTIPFTNFNSINSEIFNKAFDKAVARRRNKQIPSKLQNMGDTFLTHAKAQQIDPFIIAAISLYESDRGTSSLAVKQNNVGGLRSGGQWMRFDTVEDSIKTQARTIKSNVEAGRTTLESLACSGKYCATNTSHWGSSVKSINNELRKFYNQIVQGN